MARAVLSIQRHTLGLNEACEVAASGVTCAAGGPDASLGTIVKPDEPSCSSQSGVVSVRVAGGKAAASPTKEGTNDAPGKAVEEARRQEVHVAGADDERGQQQVIPEPGHYSVLFVVAPGVGGFTSYFDGHFALISVATNPLSVRWPVMTTSAPG